MCAKCRSWVECGEEGGFCLAGKSNCIAGKRGCIRSACLVTEVMGLTCDYCCITGGRQTRGRRG
ncbi:MAG: DUF2769 domain-containing protein [Candidatus Cryosericum sp.]|nr:DUF2769 domain-containing protein [bacterium]